MAPRAVESEGSVPSTSGRSIDAPLVNSELNRALRRVLTSGTRAALAGFILRGGLHALSTLVFLLAKLRRTSKPARKRELSWLAALQDTLKYTAFLGAMGTVYVTVDESLAGLFGRQRSSKWRALIAGALAGQTLLITGSQTRQYSLGTYVLLRGLTLLIRTANKPEADPRLRMLLAPTRLEHGDTALMCMSAAQIVYAFIMVPSSLPRSYVRFISKHGAKDTWVWKAVQEQALRNYYGEAPGPLKLLRGTPYAGLHERVPCRFYHPGHTCCSHAVSGIPASYGRAVGVYGPMYLVTAILVHRKKLLKDPVQIWPKVAMGIARSSLFLTLYITLAFSGVCIAFNSTGTSTGTLIASSVWIGGLATLLEKKSRRMELALYCLSRALESGARCLGEWGVIDPAMMPPRLDVLLFSIGCAAIMNTYSGDSGKHRDVFKSKYLNVLDFVFGNTGLDAGSIRHCPSNHDILRVASMRIRSYSSRRLAELDRDRDSSSREGSAGRRHHNNTRSQSSQTTSRRSEERQLAERQAQKQGWLATTGIGMRPSQSSAAWSQAKKLLQPRAGPSTPSEPPPKPPRRSMTDPCFGPCEERVHGADRGIRGWQLRGEPSLSDLKGLMLPTKRVSLTGKDSAASSVSAAPAVPEARAGATVGAAGVERSSASNDSNGSSCAASSGTAGHSPQRSLDKPDSCVLRANADEPPESPRWGTLWQQGPDAE